MRAQARRSRRPGPAAPRSRILILRHCRHQWDYNEDFRLWLADVVPQCAALLEWHELSAPLPRDPSRYALLVPWLQDPLAERFPGCHARALEWQRVLTAAGAAVVNPVQSLSVSLKSRALPLIGGTGLRTARSLAFDRLDELQAHPQCPPLPLLVRDDVRHGSPLQLIERWDDIGRISLAGIDHPLALEFIDTRGTDGLYRKYRAFVFGGHCVPRHLVIGRDPFLHVRDRVQTPAARSEELGYLYGPPPPQAAQFEAARRALGLDFVAFDYAFDRQGRTVVFEPNPLPLLWSRGNQQRRYRDYYQLPALERLYLQLLHWLLERAGLAEAAWALPGPSAPVFWGRP